MVRAPRWLSVAVIAVVAAACGSRAASVPAGTERAKPGVEVTLYRDHAVVGHRLEVTV
nr:hypothetical protein [Deltaproteobacteria bacterium]